MNPDIKQYIDDCVTSEKIEFRLYVDKSINEDKDKNTREIDEKMKLLGISTVDINNLNKHMKGKLPPMYRNLDNHNLTWSGKGKPPNWFKEIIAKGLSEGLSETEAKELMKI